MVKFMANMLDLNATLNNPISRKKSNKWDNPIGKNMSPLQQAKNVAMLIKKRLEASSKNDQSKEVFNKVRVVSLKTRLFLIKKLTKVFYHSES